MSQQKTSTVASSSNTIRLILPKPFDWQRKVKMEASRFNVVDVGRRAGKTALGLDLCVTPESLPYPVGWFSPTYKMLLEVWREAVRTFAPILSRRNIQERRLEFITGGLLEFWSLDNPDVARGRKYRRIIVDEAAMVPSLMDVWQYALRPTLADYQGDAWFLSTPKGRNAFWQMWQWGQDAAMPEWASWQMPSSVNPTLAPSELDEMRRTMPERTYQQEILASFVEDAGLVFRRVPAAVADTWQDEAQDGGQYVFGVDWARSGDWTVITVIDIATSAVVHIDRFNQVEYSLQLRRLQGLYDRFRPSTIIAEANSMGGPLVEALQRMDLPVQPFTTTNATKASIIDSLALAFERGDIRIPDDATLIAELQAFEMDKLPSGLMRYSAPDGLHDDCVMSLALAWAGVETGQPLLLW